MRIGIDGNEANVDKLVGVSVYTLQLLKRFSEKANENLSFEIYLREPAKSHMPKGNDHFVYTVVGAPMLWSQVFLPLHLHTNKKPDVFFAPAHYSPRFNPVPLVVTIHDLSYFYYPNEFLKEDLYKLRSWTQYAVSHAKKVIAVSKNTKKDVVKHYNTAENKVTVVYNGFDKSSSSKDTDVLSRFSLSDKKYVLYVGTLQPRKNVPALIASMKQVVAEESEMRLVLVGKKGWLYEEIFATVQSEGMESHVIFTDYLPDDDVQTLYKHAFCYVLPSLYEGFGIPILEAMANGCPVVTSYTSSLPEVGGDACLYFDPHTPHDLTEKILRLQDASVRKGLVAKGKERVKEFSWDRCAEETLAVIQKAV